MVNSLLDNLLSDLTFKPAQENMIPAVKSKKTKKESILENVKQDDRSKYIRVTTVNESG